MKTSRRIHKIAEMCHGARRVIDVGCDHAQLCAYLVAECGVEKAFASDLREGPLENAKRTVSALGLSDKIETILCNGLEAFGPDQADTIVIAGMGGDEIAAILERAVWPLEGKHTLILQPMTAAERLRKWLEDHCCGILEEQFIEDGGKFYAVLRVKGKTAGSDAQKYAYLFSEKALSDPLFPQYLHKLKLKYHKIAEGQKKAGLAETPEQNALKILSSLVETEGSSCR